MNCPNCNSNINKGENFCRVCGKQVNIQSTAPNSEVVINNQSQEYSQIPTWNLTSTEINNISDGMNNINNQTIQPNQQNQINFNKPNTLSNLVQFNNSLNQQTNSNNQSNINQSDNFIQQENNNQYNSQQQATVNPDATQSFKPQTVFNTPYQQTIKNDPYEDDMLIDAYIGKKSYGITKGGFSWCTFFFGVFYVYYRKMYIFGIIWSAINIVLNNILGSLEFLSSIISLVINIGAACIFKEKYLEHVNKKVNEIKEKNPDKSHEELLSICRKKGGASILPIAIYISIIFVISFLESLPAFRLYFNAKEKLEELEKEKNQINEVELGELTMEVPSNFTEVEGSNRKTDYFLLTDNDFCALKTNKLTSTTTAEEYLNDYITITYEIIEHPINNKIINNNTWYYSVIQTEGNNNATSEGIRYYYVTKGANTIYQLEFIIYKDETKQCSKARETIVNSLNFN